MIADLLDAAAEILRPLEVLTPAAFAQRYRVVEGGPFAGKWDNENGPYLVDVMNAVQEALESGRHLVVIKGAQEGVTEALGVNAVMWLLTYYGGPILYLTSKDDNAKKVARTRWDSVLKTCEPLKKKFLPGKAHGEQILEKRFTDGSLTLSGSRSLLNLISNPYCVVVFDELDSGQDHMQDGSDPIAIVLERLTAYAEGRPVLVIAFAHPTTKTRGAAKLYYTKSDQRRAHVECPHCGEWFAPLWEHVRVVERPGQSPAAAERDPSCYRLFARCCGAELSDADRLGMIRSVQQRSTLPAEVARTKEWIGLHLWHVFLRRGGAIERLAKKHIAGLDDEGEAIVFKNKSCGDVVEVESVENPDEDAWRACIALPRFDGDRAAYYRGELPAEVSLLTAGTDANMASLHWTIWGWGLLPMRDGGRVRCGWLLDWGEVKREPPEKALDAADLLPLEQLIYARAWKRPDGRVISPVMIGHDSGWLPEGVYEFADKRAPRGIPVRGGNDDENSRSPLLRWGKKPKRFVKNTEVPWRDPRLAVLNTFLAKRMFFALVRRRFVGAGDEHERWRLHLPVDVDEEIITHLSSESLARSGRKLVWVRDASKPNHLSDCSIYAFVLAEQAAVAQRGQTADELQKRAASNAPAPAQNDEEEKPRWKVGR